MKQSNIFLRLATLGPVGFLIAPGTCATIATLPLVYLLAQLPAIANVIVTVAITCISFFVIKKVLPHFSSCDPSAVVVDELAGCLVTFCGVPLNMRSIIIGVALFRFFDISKWFGIRRCEAVSGAWGVLLDDLIAGLLSNILLHFLVS